MCAEHLELTRSVLVIEEGVSLRSSIREHDVTRGVKISSRENGGPPE
jgi:hypothetical protein